VSRSKAIEEFREGMDPADCVGQLILIPPRHVKRLPSQPRTHFDPKQLERLRESIAAIGQQQPATVIPWQDCTFRIRDGERRWRCCVALKRALLALVVDAKSEEEEFELSAAANMNRESHSPLEKSLAMKRLRDGPLKRTVPEIARTFGVHEVTVYNHLLIVDRLPGEVLDLMDPNRMGSRKRTLQMSAGVYLTAIADHPAAVLRIARQIVRDNLSLHAAKAVIDKFADAKGIESGRGRERSPADRLDLLTSSLTKLTLRLEFFAGKTQREIDSLWGFMPHHRHEDLVERIGAAIADLSALHEKLVQVEGVSTRRWAGV